MPEASLSHNHAAYENAIGAIGRPIVKEPGYAAAFGAARSNMP
jgi:hypothetical protein